MIHDTTETPSLHDQLTDANVRVGGLPDERIDEAFAADTFGWDEPLSDSALDEIYVARMEARKCVLNALRLIRLGWALRGVRR